MNIPLGVWGSRRSPHPKNNPPFASPHVESNPDHFESDRRHSKSSDPIGAGGFVTRITLTRGTLTSAGGG
jgi:hypothetical protein